MRTLVAVGAIIGVTGLVAGLGWLASASRLPSEQPERSPLAVTQAEPVVSAPVVPEAKRERRRAVVRPRVEPVAAAVSPETECEEAAPENQTVREYGPPDLGDLSVHIQLRDADTGAAVGTRVELWRLAAPATDTWSAGDYLHTGVAIEANGTWIENLPPARYRLFVRGLRESAEDPPEFELTTAGQSVFAALAMPRLQPARVLVFDEQSRLITRAELSRGGGGSSSGAAWPTWATRRRRLDGQGWRSLRMGMG